MVRQPNVSYGTADWTDERSVTRLDVRARLGVWTAPALTGPYGAYSTYGTYRTCASPSAEAFCTAVAIGCSSDFGRRRAASLDDLAIRLVVVAPSGSTLFSAVVSAMVGAMVGAGGWRWWLALVVGAGDCRFWFRTQVWSALVNIGWLPQEVVLLLLRSRFGLVTGVLQ